MKLLVLYEELAGYFIASLGHFADTYNVEVLVIHKEANVKEAPFKIGTYKNIGFQDRSAYTEKELIELSRNFNPDAIFCGGWKTKAYLNIASLFKSKIPVIVGFDNKWEGTLKQHIASLLSPVFIKRNFNLCWVPGEKQKKFALKLGFNETQIETGAYAADHKLFYNEYLKYRQAKTTKFPHRFLFVGRYIPSKGITDLWEAFIELGQEQANDWELWCLGTGDIEPINHPKIKHFGFVQPHEIDKFIESTGVFVLPSHFEPWGVVIHEYASAGFPLVCSSEVGAAEAFLEEGQNGYLYRSGNIPELKKALKKVIDCNDETLIKMGERSVEKAKQNTPEKWAEKLHSLVSKKI